MLNPRARRAMAWPIRPNPTIPIVEPQTSVPSSSSGPHVFQLSGAHVAVALGDAASRRHEQREGEVRGRFGQRPRRVPDRHPAGRRLGHDDVVEADGVVAHDLELRPGAVEELRVDPVGEQREDAVHALDRAEQDVARRRQVVRPDGRVGRLEDPAQALVGDAPADEHARAVGHWGSSSWIGAPRRATDGETGGQTRAAARGSATDRIRSRASAMFSRELA